MIPTEGTSLVQAYIAIQFCSFSLMRSSNRLGLEIVHGLINTSTNNEEDKVTFLCVWFYLLLVIMI